MPAARRKPTEYHHGNLREALMGLAMQRIAARGAPDFTLRELAAEAGVTHAATYRHFASREALLAAIAAWGYRELHAREAAAQAARGPDPWARLLVLPETYLAFMLDAPGAFHIMLGHRWTDDETWADAVAARAESYALLEETARACQRAGILPDGNPARLIAAMLGVTHGLASLWLNGQFGVVAGASDAKALIRETVCASFEAFRASDPVLWRDA
ncbi:TetR/AcrR family transcriptional regulator [Parvibaculum sp.]|uniref:TetR/AcrR family transcriptional regulator n=1 Tax=Parvibaculum sp. TaxID=2024848 RepID=UPI0034A0446E